MGTTHAQQPGQTSIGCAYLAKVLQGVKREVDSKVEVQSSSSRESYDFWRKGLQSYKDKIERAFPSDADAILNSLLLPCSTLFEQNGNICSDKQGKVILEFSTGFLSLQESKSLHIQQNMPYTTAEIWNLLFHMVDYDLMIKRTGLPLQVRTETLYTDLRSKTVKLRNPYSFFTSQFKCKHEKYVDPQKLGLLLRGLKVPPQIEEQNNLFNIGMTLVEIMLLQSNCIIYQQGLSQHRHINPILHEMLIEKVLKLTYYPLKLRMVVVGLIQLQFKDRFTSQEVHALLLDSRQKIKSFQTFHLRKTAFEKIFQHKLATLEALMNRIKHDCSSFIFKEGVPVTSAERKPKKHKTADHAHNKNSAHLEAPSGHMDQSFNFSITHIAHNNRPHDLQSLNFSKSDNKSIVLHEKSSLRERSIASNTANNNEAIKQSEASINSLPANTPTNISATAAPKTSDKIESPLFTSQSPPDLSRTPNDDIVDPFTDFEPEKKTNQSKELLQLSSSAKTPPRPPDKSQKHSNSLKIYEQNRSQPMKGLVTPDLRLSANLELIQTEKKISVQAGKENEQHQQDISCIPQNQKDPLGDASRNSSVVQYVSELYETSRPLEKTKAEKVVESPQPRNSWESEKQGGLFDSFEPRKLLIKKTESYQIQSNSHSSFEPPREVVHQGSIIDRLAPLVKSKKAIPEDGYKPESLTDSARKRMEYWNTFSKFSPEVIAQLHLPAKYPETERLKRSMRETISYHNMAISRTKKMFPEDQRASADDISSPKVGTD